MRSLILTSVVALTICICAIGCSSGSTPDAAALIESKKVVKGKGGGNATPAEGPAPPIIRK